MGALCWVLPLEEDADTLEDSEGVGLLDEATCCLGRRAPEGFALLVKRSIFDWLISLDRTELQKLQKPKKTQEELTGSLTLSPQLPVTWKT